MRYNVIVHADDVYVIEDDDMAAQIWAVMERRYKVDKDNDHLWWHCISVMDKNDAEVLLNALKNGEG